MRLIYICITKIKPKCYGARPILHLADHTILSCLLINAWYLDDGTLCGSPDNLAAALSIIEAEGPPWGLLLNRSKSSIVAPAISSMNHLLLFDIPVTSEGFSLLGSPLGSPEYCLMSALARIKKVQDGLHRLSDLQDSQMEATLLCSCLSLPKVAYMIRTCPPGLIQRALEEFDHTMREAVSDITGCPLSNWARLKVSCPSSLGGLNIRQVSLHAPAAFIGSFHRSEPLISEILGHPARMLQHLPNTISALDKAAARPEWLSIQCIDVSLHSHSLSPCSS